MFYVARVIRFSVFLELLWKSTLLVRYKLNIFHNPRVEKVLIFLHCSFVDTLGLYRYLEAGTRRAGLEELTMILPPWSIERERVGSLLMWF